MGKVKGILKRISGGLKMAVGFAPLIIIGSGFLIGIGGVLGKGICEGSALDFKNTEEYMEIYHEDSMAINTEYANGEISTTEFTEKIEYLGTDKYVREALDKAEGAEKYKNYLKQSRTSMVVGLTGAGMMAGGLVLCAPMYATKLGDTCCESAEKDFKYVAEERKKCEQEKKQKLEEEVKPFIDNEEDENLPSIDNDYYND